MYELDGVFRESHRLVVVCLGRTTSDWCVGYEDTTQNTYIAPVNHNL
jgi:hypothetical protein